MANLYVFAILVLLFVSVADADPKPKQVFCDDFKNFPICYDRDDLYCPAACPDKCTVDCATCTPTCTLPPPPPPKVPQPRNVFCNDKSYRSCFKRTDLYCPITCPRRCTVDCATCKPVCRPPRRNNSPPPYVYSSPPPPPYVYSSPPPPPYVYSSPPPPSYVYSSPPPPPYVYSSPPPPPYVYSSPPPPSYVYSSPPPPPYVYSSPPPPPYVYSSPPPPSYVYSSPPPPTNNTPSPPLGSPPNTTPPPQSSGVKKARCKNKNYPNCYMIEHNCPSACPYHCEVDCVTCSPVCNCNKPGAVCQDPRFVGADGITFYFHGKSNKDFCIVSDSNIHINAHFIGRRNSNMKRDFTWVQSLGILFGSHKLYIGAEKTSIWDDKIDKLALSFDGAPVFLPTNEGAMWQPSVGSGVTVTRNRNVNSMEIQVEGNFKIIATVVPITEKDSKIHKYGVTEEDCFAHLDLSFKFYSLSGDVNGVLGQTYATNYVSRAKMGVRMPVLGGNREFASSNLFSTDCIVSRFNGGTNSSEIFEFGKLDCASGMDGQGIICKR